MRSLLLILALFVLTTPQLSAAPAGSAFTYQGELAQSGTPANGIFQMTFELFDAEVAGSSQAAAVGPSPVKIEDGIFTTELDFGLAPFDGDQLWLQITIDGTPLTPRQKLTASPFALAALQQNYERVAIVSAQGGNFTDPLMAMTDLSSWCPAPSASARCLIFMLPGEYVLPSQLNLQAYVDLHGIDREQVLLSRNNTGTGSVLNADACGAPGCSIADFRIETISTSPADSTSAIRSTLGRIKGRNIRIDVTGDEGNSGPTHAILSDSDVEIEGLQVYWEAFYGPAIQVLNNATVRLKNCLIEASSLGGSTVWGVEISGRLFTERCRIDARNDYESGRARTVRVINGAMEDLYSHFSAEADQTGIAFGAHTCSLGPVQMTGTRLTTTPGSFNSVGVSLNLCTANLTGLDIDVRGSTADGISLVVSDMELRHSSVISDGTGIGFAGVVNPDTFNGQVSYSLIRAPGVIVASSTQVQMSVMYSRLEGGGTLDPGINCAYNIDETFADIICP